jgi:hypothetical protein
MYAAEVQYAFSFYNNFTCFVLIKYASQIEGVLQLVIKQARIEQNCKQYKNVV